MSAKKQTRATPQQMLPPKFTRSTDIILSKYLYQETVVIFIRCLLIPISLNFSVCEDRCFYGDQKFSDR